MFVDQLHPMKTDVMAFEGFRK